MKNKSITPSRYYPDGTRKPMIFCYQYAQYDYFSIFVVLVLTQERLKLDILPVGVKIIQLVLKAMRTKDARLVW